MSTILLVEDQAICREPLAKLLRYEGFNVVAASNGIEAMQILNEHPIDLLLLDLILPKLSGLALFEKIRREPRWCELPVIVVTGVMDSSQIAHVVLELNAKEVFSKMRFSLDELLRTIRESIPIQETTGRP